MLFKWLKYRLQDETGGGGGGFAGAIVGGVIGFLIGGPVGAMVGFGMMMGASIAAESLMPEVPDYSTPEIDNSPTYSSNQILNTVSEGIPVPRVYGRCRIGANKIRFNAKNAADFRVIYAYCRGEIESITDWAVNDVSWGSLIQDGHTKSTYLGTRAQTPDGRFTTQASAYRGIAYDAMTFVKDNQISGDPHITALIDGLLCAPLAGGADAFTRNPAVALYDWYLNVEGYSAGDINLNSFKSLEALCDEVPAGSARARYMFDFSFDTNITINDAKKIIWQAFNGRVIMSQGKLKAVWDSAQMEDGSGGLTAKTVSHAFDVDNIVKDSLTWHQPERPNIVRIHYLDSDVLHKKTNVEVKDEHDISINGEILYEEDCWFITHGELARRRAQYKFNKFKYTDYVAKLSALSGAGDLEVYDLVTVTHTLPGWTAKQFLVKQKSEDQYGRMQFVLEAYYSGVYDDAQTGDQTGYEPDLPNPFDTPYEIAVGDITLTEATSQTFHWSPAVVVTFVEPTADPFWSHVEVWISTDDVTFTFYGITSAHDGFTIETTGAMFQPGATLYVKLLSVSESGVKDSLTNITSKSIVLSSVIRLGNFYVHADSFGNNATAADATILLDSTNTWIRVGATGSDFLMLDGDYGGEPAVWSSNYVAGMAGEGFLLKSDLLEVGNIACRGIFRMAVFQYDVISAIGGNVFIAKGSDVLDTDMVVGGGTPGYGGGLYGTVEYGAGVGSLTIEGNVTFDIGDILRIKDADDDEWLQVTGIGSAPTYDVDRDRGDTYALDTNPAWKKGATVVNYGQTGDGVIYLTASEANGPHISVLTHEGEPWDTITTRLRVGNLNGFLGYTTDLYGIAIGEDTAYLKYDPTNGLRIRGTIAIESMYRLPDDENLVGYWSFDDGVGDVAIDNSGHGNDGIVMETPTWIDGISGQGLSFTDSVDCCVSIAAFTGLPTTAITVCCWAYIDAMADYHNYIAHEWAPTDPVGWLLYSDTTRVYFGLRHTVGGQMTANVIQDISGGWHFLCGTYDGSDVKIYIDGDLKNTYTWGAYTLDSAGDVNISVDGLAKKMDEVRIYNTALSAEEIKALYLYPSGNKSTAISGGQTPWASGSDVTKIDGGNIYTDTITATQINGAGFGTLTITSGKLAINTTDALEIMAGGNVNVLAGGDIVLVGSNSDPGNIFFEGSSYSVKFGGDADGSNFYISPATDGDVNINIGSDTPWYSDKMAAEVIIKARNDIDIKQKLQTQDTYSEIMLSSTVASCTITFAQRLNAVGDSTALAMYQSTTLNEFSPNADQVWDLGAASYAWDTAYADDFTNVADFYYLDDRDDLAAIQAIESSGIIDDVTGLELIDDDTIPKWMLSKYKRDTEKCKINGVRIPARKKGDIIYNLDGKPYLSLKLMNSLLMGAIKQLDAKIEVLTAIHP